ncbi:hypothetical protein HMF7854_02950 [Sphingomonas ginkgonis]|uniref:Uncharacterized protein n=1 Tax=Sphingomonas ginkgonis TaxID=2315330 RepID=A0A3R9WMG3_9SPHN|nr:hypothetical protein [Sphingomonas ginkgonis]RST29895.1 hypothetical protein HMF7854_02950 [Sphingomonas ginkgonis]
MSELLSTYWPIILICVAIGVIVGMIAFRPRQKVELTDSAPTRPHMQQVARETPPPAAPTMTRTAHEGRGIADEMAAATSDIAGDFVGARVHDNLPNADGPPDDLQRMKGVGPKLAAMLNDKGLTRFAQIAALTPDQLENLDAELGAFRGRLTRDQIPQQADYLSRGDQDGFEARFGKL